MANGELDEESLNDLYSWVDAIPLSRPKRNIARDFSDGVLVAEVVKFYFPKIVEMHNYAPANSTQQKLSNWGHLNRKVLSKLNFSIPEDMVRKIAQCTPGMVELVLIPLRQKIEEKQKQAKMSSSYQGHPPTAVGSCSLCSFPSPLPQELGMRSTLEENNYLDTGFTSKPKPNSTQDSPGLERGPKGHQSYTVPLQTDANLRLHLAEREQALLASQEMVQILQMKVRRLEHLLHLKNVRIDDLTRRLQQAEQRRK
ncbi:sperm flagellar protein 1 isoform X1 [Podarcis muralis]|uniref:Sperm flagellar protein 1 n=1 Tax=Podarcis muralis TaxID=64176 RepID=A0A670IX20_PODMU|nr:sperm flagellar protein 1 isoform X1 [Podarcis muralis]XP_053258177.1 sperm flagellar protein 1 isoform X1 [Podarcis raffonei]